jgi:hypothetical protein
VLKWRNWGSLNIISLPPLWLGFWIFYGPPNIFWSLKFILGYPILLVIVPSNAFKMKILSFSSLYEVHLCMKSPFRSYCLLKIHFSRYSQYIRYCVRLNCIHKNNIRSLIKGSPVCCLLWQQQQQEQCVVQYDSHIQFTYTANQWSNNITFISIWKKCVSSSKSTFTWLYLLILIKLILTTKHFIQQEINVLVHQ